MEPQFQTSFIPKKPIVSGIRDSIGEVGSVNYFSIFVTMVFVAALIASVGLFVYEKVLNSEIAQADKDLTAAKDAFQIATTKELIDVSTRISSTQKLLNSHVVTSQIFAALQDLTVKKVSFNNFVFSYKDGGVYVTMDSEAQSYNALAQQSNILSKTAFVKSSEFSDFDISEKGNITSKLTALIDPALISYKKFTDSLNLNP